MKRSRPDFARPLAAVALVAAALAGCGGNGSGVSTASVLDGATTKSASELGAIKNDDPNARVIQVAWTSARAQRCGFVFDGARLKANFLAAEATRVGPTGTGANTEKVYDQTFGTIKGRIAGEEDYCTIAKTAAIKADLQRHLAGDYEPNFPKPKPVVASGGFFDALVDDTPRDEKFSADKFWKDQAAKQSGAKGAQQTGD